MSHFRPSPRSTEIFRYEILGTNMSSYISSFLTFPETPIESENDMIISGNDLKNIFIEDLRYKISNDDYLLLKSYSENLNLDTLTILADNKCRILSQEYPCDTAYEIFHKYLTLVNILTVQFTFPTENHSFLLSVNREDDQRILKSTEGLIKDLTVLYQIKSILFRCGLDYITQFIVSNNYDFHFSVSSSFVLQGISVTTSSLVESLHFYAKMAHLGAFTPKVTSFFVDFTGKSSLYFDFADTSIRVYADKESIEETEHRISLIQNLFDFQITKINTNVLNFDA
jgi:hypothetical protein